MTWMLPSKHWRFKYIFQKYFHSKKIFVLSMKIGNLYFQGKFKFYTFNDDAVFENEDQVLEKRAKSTKDGIRGRGKKCICLFIICIAVNQMHFSKPGGPNSREQLRSKSILLDRSRRPFYKCQFFLSYKNSFLIIID